MKPSHQRAAERRPHPYQVSTAELEPYFESMVEKAIRAIVSGDAKLDGVFGGYAELVSVARSVAFHEGKLLEWAIAAIARCNPDLLVLPPDRPMPIVPAALELLKRNEWSDIQGIRLPSEVHTTKTYTPDLFIADRRRHAGLIMDVKRAVSSYGENRLEELRRRMIAVAAIASSWLGERQGPVLVEVRTAIIDGADEISDHDKGVFALSEIGDLLGVEGAGEAMKHLRAMFARRVQVELGSQCRKALGCRPGCHHRVLSDPDPDAFDSGEFLGADQDSFAPHDRSERRRLLQIPPLQTNVRLGFARSRASP